jgi:CHAD domain-containing protein
MADGKWVPDLSAATPLPAAARRALEVRLRAVEAALPPAAEQAAADPEHVHQLRVATRRCRAALDLFADLLPARLARRLRRALRRLRRMAGAARDWDVFLDALAGPLRKPPAAQAAGLHWLAGQALARRLAAQAELSAYGPADYQKLHDLAEDVLRAAGKARPDPGTPQTLGDAARRHLPRLLDDLEEAARGDLRDYEHLHQVRIRGKHLRYAMELFSDCFAPAFRDDLYPRVEELQDILGRANDCHVGAQRVAAMRDEAQAYRPALWPLWRAGVEALRRTLRRQLATQRRRFLRWWDRWQADGVRERFIQLVASPAALAAAEEE